jgi:shikimate kinase
MMRVSFIGMSNIGKTYWAKRISAEYGIKNVNCDSCIEHMMEPELKALGFRGLRDVAKWMGQPPAPQYEANSDRYVECEKTVMSEIIERLGTQPEESIVIDTTGSVIYSGVGILAGLRRHTRIIYFEASDAHIDSLFKRYLTHPKPLIWGNAFKPQEGEAAQETLRRCYPELLRDRAWHYAKLAHITVPYERHRDRAHSIGAIIEEALKEVAKS